MYADNGNLLRLCDLQVAQQHTFPALIYCSRWAAYLLRSLRYNTVIWRAKINSTNLQKFPFLFKLVHRRTMSGSARFRLARDLHSLFLLGVKLAPDSFLQVMGKSVQLDCFFLPVNLDPAMSKTFLFNQLRSSSNIKKRNFCNC